RTVNEDAGVTSFASVLGNDTDADDAPLIAADLTDPIGSALTLTEVINDLTGPYVAHPLLTSGDTGLLVDFNDDGTFDYDPNGEFESLGEGDTAFVEFDYTAYDGHGAFDDATVTLEIVGENDNPTGVSPDAVKVYEAGLATGSQDDPDDTGIPIVQDIDITIDDVDFSDIPFVAGTSGGDTTTLVGTNGTLEFVDEDTVRYTLTSNADHDAVQGHNGGIFDNFSVWVVDEHGGASEELTVTVEIIDDINFLAVAPVDGTGTPLFTADTLDDTSVAFSTGASTSDLYTLVPGADGQSLDVVGIPDVFTLGDGRTVTSAVVSENGTAVVEGTDSEGALFYRMVFDPDPDSDASTLLGNYTLTVFQDPPVVVNNIDFSALKAGGPQEDVTVQNIGFDGGFIPSTFDPDGDGDSDGNDDSLAFDFDDVGIPGNNDDFINPNNAGGIGIGNGNIERFEVLEIDVTG
ncbi:MAG: VCBS domain-containing protein, partial [Acidimicrobiia bacterium]|nr:VCBS domain-containing protein [Acidimicrobiia bacterium]